jgi:hypothetical protein
VLVVSKNFFIDPFAPIEMPADIVPRPPYINREILASAVSELAAATVQSPTGPILIPSTAPGTAPPSVLKNPAGTGVAKATFLRPAALGAFSTEIIHQFPEPTQQGTIITVEKTLPVSLSALRVIVLTINANHACDRLH